MTTRQERLSSLFSKLSAQFLQKAYAGRELVTVTGCTISKDLEKGTLFLSVYPEGNEKRVLDSLSGMKQELRYFLSKHTEIKTLPYFDFEIDYGEKNRKRIEDLLKKK